MLPKIEWVSTKSRGPSTVARIEDLNGANALLAWLAHDADRVVMCFILSTPGVDMACNKTSRSERSCDRCP